MGVGTTKKGNTVDVDEPLVDATSSTSETLHPADQCSQRYVWKSGLQERTQFWAAHSIVGVQLCHRYGQRFLVIRLNPYHHTRLIALA